MTMRQLNYTDLWLVYVDKSGSKHYVHWLDSDVVGVPLNDDGDDMELVAWTMDPAEDGGVG